MSKDNPKTATEVQFYIDQELRQKDIDDIQRLSDKYNMVFIGHCENCKWWWTDGCEVPHNRCECPHANYFIDADNIDPTKFGCIEWQSKYPNP